MARGLGGVELEELHANGGYICKGRFGDPRGEIIAEIKFPWSPEKGAYQHVLAAGPKLLAACELAADCIGDESILRVLREAITAAKPEPEPAEID
jgi:hypothetical protein